MKQSNHKTKLYEPRIVAFTCDWGPCSAADLAGSERIQYPPNVTIIGLPCSGRISAAVILETFKIGVDGVLVTGCPVGDCHYISGNEKAEAVFKLTRKLMKVLGIEAQRLKQEWVSSPEAQRFAQLVTEFTEEMRQLGPSPLRQ